MTKFSTPCIFLFVLLSSLIVNVAIGQNKLPSEALLQSLNDAAVVVEGFVDDYERSRIDINGRIVTDHQLIIDHVIKGEHNLETIMVSTPGGIIGSKSQSISHSASLRPSTRGIFLLNLPSDDNSSYTLYGGDEGKITRLQNDDDFTAIRWGVIERYKSWRQLRESVWASLGNDCSIKPLTLLEVEGFTQNKELCVKLDNPVPNFEDMTVEFDVLAKSNVQGLKFGRADIVINYPTGNLGEWIVQQETIEAEKSDITNGDAYSIEVTDKSEDQISLAIESDCQGPDPHYVLDTVYEKLATVTVEVEEFGNLGTMSVNDFAIEGEAEYIVPNSFAGSTPGCAPFDDLCGEEDGDFNFMSCTMNANDGLFHAGVQQSITLTGTDFGPQSAAQVFIPQAESGGITWLAFDADNGRVVNSWSNNSISLKVLNTMAGSVVNPTPASSGRWQVLASGASLRCETEIEVGYSIDADVEPINSTAYREERYIYPIGALQEEFGYPVTGALEVFVVGSTLSDNNIDPVAFDAVMKEVICKWEAASIVEINYNGIGLPPVTSPTDPALGSNPSTILTVSFGFTSLPGSIAETVMNADITNRCGNSTFSYILDQDIVLNDNIDFHVGLGENVPNGFYDLYSVLLHEFGHALGHSHANDIDRTNQDDDSRLMYFEITPEKIKRSIDNYGISGAEDFWSYTKNETSPGSSCFAPADAALIGPLDVMPDQHTCETNSIFSTTERTQLCFDIATVNSTIKFLNSRNNNLPVTVIISNSVGQRLLTSKFFNLNTELDISSIDYKGLAVVSVIASDGSICSEKISLF